jgi:hypothetical protein
MNKKNGIKVGFIAAVIALLVVAVAVPAGAGDLKKNFDLNRLLSGDYAGNNSFTCAWSIFGFNPEDLGRIPYTGVLSGFNMTGSAQGVTHYDGHGRYTYKGEVLSVANETAGSTAPAKYPVAQYKMDCEGNYEVDKYLRIRSWDGECTFIATAGPDKDVEDFRIVISNMEGKGQLMGTMGNILGLRTDTKPNVEKVEIYNSPDFPSPPYPNPLPVERICTSSGMSMKLARPVR